jgi:hypothetical protein
MPNKQIKIGEEIVTLPTNTIFTLYIELKNIIGKGQINRSNIITIVLSLMQVVEQYESLKGKQKKAAIIDVLNQLIDEQVPMEQEALELKSLVYLTLPTVIDAMVSIDKKEVEIKVKNCCKKLISCLGL